MNLDMQECLPCRELTYPTWGKGKSSSRVPWEKDMLVPWRVILADPISVAEW